MCAGATLCTEAAKVAAKGGTCNTGARPFDAAACATVTAGGCAGDTANLCAYVECIVAGPTCVAGQEQQYIAANAHCLSFYQMLSSGCQAAIVAATSTGGVDMATAGGDKCLALANEGSCDYTGAPLYICREYNGNYPAAEVMSACPGSGMSSVYTSAACKAGSVGHCSTPDTNLPSARCQLIYYYPPQFTTASAQDHCTKYEHGTFYGP